MSTRTVLRPHVVITGGDMSAASITSEATILQGITNIGYEVSWTGSTPVGTLVLQVSNTYSVNATGAVERAGTWTPVPMDVNGAYATSIAISGNTGKGYIDVTLHAGYAAQLVYTKGSGTGTLNATISGKVA